MNNGYFKKGRWIESDDRTASHELQIIDDIINNNISIKLDGQILKLKSYLISHDYKEFPNIVLELSDNTKLDVNVVADEVDLRIGNTRYIAEDQTKLNRFLETPVLLEKTIIGPDKIIDVFNDGVILPRTHVKDGEEAYIQQQLSNFKDTGIFKVYDPVIPDDLKVKLDKNGNIVDEHDIQSVSQQKQGFVKRLRNLINV